MTNAAGPLESSSALRPPGLRRRIMLHPRAGAITVALEDNFHRFILHLDHADGIITRADVRTDRGPFTTCGGAGGFLHEQVTGRALGDFAGLDPALHCTHLYDLLILGAAHARDAAPTRLDAAVDDRVDERTTATLIENGAEVLRWDLDGLRIIGPGHWAGRDLRRLSTWQRELDPPVAEHARILRRAIFISGGRRMAPDTPPRAADRGAQRIGVCYTYQLPRALEAYQSPDWRRDFSRAPDEPLAGFDPDAR